MKRLHATDIEMSYFFSTDTPLVPSRLPSGEYHIGLPETSMFVVDLDDVSSRTTSRRVLQVRSRNLEHSAFFSMFDSGLRSGAFPDFCLRIPYSLFFSGSTKVIEPLVKCSSYWRFCKLYFKIDDAMALVHRKLQTTIHLSTTLAFSRVADVVLHKESLGTLDFAIPDEISSRELIIAMRLGSIIMDIDD